MLIAFCIVLAVAALGGVIGTRVWLLRKIKDAQKKEERPFD